jgi:hypothetical protein
LLAPWRDWSFCTAIVWTSPSTLLRDERQAFSEYGFHGAVLSDRNLNVPTWGIPEVKGDCPWTLCDVELSWTWQIELVRTKIDARSLLTQALQTEKCRYLGSLDDGSFEACAGSVGEQTRY